jgi:hypothetical protein
MFVHRSSRLSATASVPAAELRGINGVFTKWALERDKAVHPLDGVMSHSFKYSHLSEYYSELKLLPPPFVVNQSRIQPPSMQRPSLTVELMKLRKQSGNSAIAVP